MLKIENLSVELSKNEIISGLNLEVLKNEVVGVIAPNGTGKTTLFRSIATLINQSRGSITINNFKVTKERVNYLKQFFYFESAESLYQNLTVNEHLFYVKEVWKSDISVETIIDKLKMREYAKKRIKNLSLGMKQHLIIAMYLVSDCPVLIFDEPLNGLDPSSVSIMIKVMKEIQTEGKIILISSHDLYNIEQICSRVVFMNEKKIVYDTENLGNLNLLYKQIFEKGGLL
ncbi:ABC transporter ATP-binding protein [Enterococcus plantarum]|uniref:ABC transporter ATP-binding protein n=1 Tax=Enterococcus plantarum TaxID=1077675 RepID=A0A2W4BXB5_9ENTE|nr:ABC transporter ATP-binding protein [Enterococcus plantarum]PZL78269.1 ABC transporter ATP-binding protein [Enterococcus plantarum]